ncbi:hypothetical protein JCM33374_g2557 [Metschnikowia sp. JCM 33374]|nr:hypothetical protein JCM33374_g2557 [Metschnikowia sp. JCM 33374]
MKLLLTLCCVATLLCSAVGTSSSTSSETSSATSSDTSPDTSSDSQGQPLTPETLRLIASPRIAPQNPNYVFESNEQQREVQGEITQQKNILKNILKDAKSFFANTNDTEPDILRNLYRSLLVRFAAVEVSSEFSQRIMPEMGEIFGLAKEISEVLTQIHEEFQANEHNK